MKYNGKEIQFMKIKQFTQDGIDVVARMAAGV
jgi:hypothetical protein